MGAEWKQSKANVFSCLWYAFNSIHPLPNCCHTPSYEAGKHLLLCFSTLWRVCLVATLLSCTSPCNNTIQRHSFPSIHWQQLISVCYTWTSFRRTKLISSPSDVIFTKWACSDDSLPLPVVTAIVWCCLPSRYCSQLHLHKCRRNPAGCVNNSGRHCAPFDHTFLFE